MAKITIYEHFALMSGYFSGAYVAGSEKIWVGFSLGMVPIILFYLIRHLWNKLESMEYQTTLKDIPKKV